MRSLSLPPDEASLSCQASPTKLDHDRSGLHSLLPLKTRLPESAPYLLPLICSSPSVSVCVMFVCVSTAVLRTAGWLCCRGLHGSQGLTRWLQRPDPACALVCRQQMAFSAFSYKLMSLRGKNCHCHGAKAESLRVRSSNGSGGRKTWLVIK